MKTSLEIINKLSDKEAVKLGSQLVELGLVDDLAKLLVRMKAIDSALMKSVQKTVNNLSAFVKVQSDLSDGYMNAIADRDDAKSDIKEALILVEKISKQAKDLGLNPNDVKGTQDVVKITANIEDTINILNKNESDVKKIISI
jgi:hypothetical protein